MSVVATLDVREVMAAFDALPSLLDRHAGQAMADAAVEIADGAKDDHDYVDRTQHLTQSIQPGEVTGSLAGTMSVDVTAGGTAGVDYAIYIEEGTRHIRPRRFLAMSLERNLDSAALRLETGIGEAFREAGL